MSPLAVLPGLALALQVLAGWQEAPPLPRPVTGNAVVGVESSVGPLVLSLLGSDPARPETAPANPVFRWDVGSETWREVSPAPGPSRDGAVAVTARGRVFLLGGRRSGAGTAVDGLSRVDVYDPVGDLWWEAAPLPIAIEAPVAGVWRDSLVFVLGGRDPRNGAGLVHVYDPVSDRWAAATPLPGDGLLGASGTVARDALVVLGGSTGAGWRGDIDPAAPERIRWRPLSPPPGPFRVAAAATPVGTRALFVGGEASGGDGSEDVGQAVSGMLVYDLLTGAWARRSGPTTPVHGQRGLARAGGWLVVAGGSPAPGAATATVWKVPVLEVIGGG